MDFRELRTFCAVAKLGSISAAARALDLGQPAATKHLKKLEEEVGTDLLLRGKRPIQLTTAGTVLLEMAGPLVEGMGALESFRFDLDQPRPVTVVTTPVLIAQVLPGPVRSFRQKYPDTLLRLWSGARPTSSPRSRRARRTWASSRPPTSRWALTSRPCSLFAGSWPPPRATR